MSGEWSIFYRKFYKNKFDEKVKNLTFVLVFRVLCYLRV